MAIFRELRGTPTNNNQQDVQIQYQQRLTAVRKAGYNIYKPRTLNCWSFKKSDGTHNGTGYNSKLDALVAIEKQICNQQ